MNGKALLNEKIKVVSGSYDIELEGLNYFRTDLEARGQLHHGILEYSRKKYLSAIVIISDSPKTDLFDCTLDEI
jgi:hypothetical protein